MDFKFQHDLRRTAARIIVPEIVHDVRDGDPWSAGLQFKQSVVGEKPLVLSGYLFRYWCTNGAITTHNESGNYNRRKFGEGEEVYEWARERVDEILGGFEHEFDVLDELARTEIPRLGPDDTQSRTLALFDVFQTYGVPVEQRDAIMQVLTDSDDFTVWLMQASLRSLTRRGSATRSARHSCEWVGTSPLRTLIAVRPVADCLSRCTFVEPGATLLRAPWTRRGDGAEVRQDGWLPGQGLPGPTDYHHGYQADRRWGQAARSALAPRSVRQDRLAAHPSRVLRPEGGRRDPRVPAEAHPADKPWTTLRKQARKQGIDPKGMRKDDLVRALSA